MAKLVNRLGEMTLGIPAQRGGRPGAIHAVRGEGGVMAAFASSPARLAAKRAACKTCKGDGCVGHCKF